MAKPRYKDGAEEDTTDELDLDKTVELSRTALHRLGRGKDGGPRPVLLAIAGPAMGRMYEISSEVLVLGRSHSADIVLVDDGISRKHAQIEVTDTELKVRDLGSTNGVFVNGKRVKSQALRDGDRVRIGSSTILKYSLQDALEENFQKRMYDSATRDSLTDVYNKRYFRESLTTEFAYYSRHNLPLSCVMLDIDHFKKINDTYGHLAGDYVLKVLAKIIGNSLRTEDILCRYGGEEFGMILRGTNVEDGFLVAERARTQVEEHAFEHDGRSFKVTVSLGVATLLDKNYPSAIQLVRAADKFLYVAKEGGRNQAIDIRNATQRKAAGPTRKIGS